MNNFCRRVWAMALFCWLTLASLPLFGQEAMLKGRIERKNNADELQLYVMGTVGEKAVELNDDGTFDIGVDLLERSRVILFWRGRSEVDWTCTFWMQPDSTLQMTLTPRKTKGRFDPKVSFEGANAALSAYANLYYQTFERENLLDSAHIASLPNFAACQQYIERTLQPIGEALMNLTDADFAEGEAMPEDMLDEEEDVAERQSPSDEEEEDEELPDQLEMARVELDYRQAQAEFTYALLRERAGQAMEGDAAFRAMLDEIDYSDVAQADAIAFMTEWRVVAHARQYAPLVEEAAQLRCLSQFVKDEDVLNEVAERIMQHFFLRVQMGDVDPTSPSCRALYAEFRSVSTSDAYDDFINTQLDILEHPELYSSDADDPASETDEDEETDDEESDDDSGEE